MTWRERIQAARERGYFTEEDREIWGEPATCLVGETVERFFSPSSLSETNKWYDAIGRVGSPLQQGIVTALYDGDFDFLERRLEAIEDRALQLKREATA